MMNSLDKQYQDLLKDILDNGNQKGDRTGTGTLSTFGQVIRHKMSDGFPLLTTKKMYWKGIITELLWFLRGDTNIKWLVENDCHIWDGDAYANYSKKWNKDSYPNDGSVVNIDPIEIEAHTKEQFIYRIKTDKTFAENWGELGPIYGQMWRDWDTDTGNKIDQIQDLISDLIKNPDSRRLMVNAWNCTYVPYAVLPPCHYGFQVWTRDLSLDERINETSKHSKFDVFDFGIGADDNYCHKVCDSYNTPRKAISLMWNQRSVDTFLGLPFNIASYGVLLELLGKIVNMVPENLIGMLGDTHLYSNHLEQAGEQITREPYALPKLEINTGSWLSESGVGGSISFSKNIDNLLKTISIEDFTINDYNYHTSIKAKLNN